MKAFKQFDLKKERRALWNYSSVLSLICFIVLLSPAFSQKENPIEEKSKMNEKTYESYSHENNDSVFCWNWHRHHFNNLLNDSSLARFQEHYNEIMNKFGQIDEMDSLKLSQWKDNFEKEFTEKFKNRNWFDSSNNYHQYWEDHFDKNFDISEYIPDKSTLDQLHKHNEEFMERFREYNKEHQKLLEKFFY